MSLVEVCCQVLDQLAGVTRQITPEDFIRPSVALNRSTYGQHLRHTLEFFLCLEKSLPGRVVNYDLRSHDEVMQTKKEVALEVIDHIKDFLNQHTGDPAISMQVSYESQTDAWTTVKTSFDRELVYNIEHAVHHMALLKIGLREVAPYVRISDDFGMAASTLRYRNSVLAAQ